MLFLKILINKMTHDAKSKSKTRRKAVAWGGQGSLDEAGLDVALTYYKTHSREPIRNHVDTDDLNFYPKFSLLP